MIPLSLMMSVKITGLQPKKKQLKREIGSLLTRSWLSQSQLKMVEGVEGSPGNKFL